MKQSNLKKFEADLIQNGGATYNLKTGEVPETGYVVSVLSPELKSSLKTLKKGIKTFVSVNAVDLENPEIYLGGWKDGDSYILDLSLVYESKEEAFMTAIANEQKVIYHLDSGDCLIRDKYNRWYKQTSQGRIYESYSYTHDAFHNTQRKQLKKIY